MEKELVKRIKAHKHVQRLKGISLSAVPQRFAKFPGPVPDRYEHSVGVSELADHLDKSFDEWRQAIKIAGLLHDIGSPPFNHISEEFMKLKFGHDHEEESLHMVQSSDIADLLSKAGIYDKVVQIFDGRNDISKIMFGKIDLDNIDNMHRFCTEVLLHKPPYSKVELAQRFVLNKDGSLAGMRSKRWEAARRTLYSYLANAHWNMSAWGMLKRAHELALEHLNEQYFKLSDDEAINVLSAYAPKIMAMLGRREYYDEVLRYETGILPKLANTNLRAETADEISKNEGIEREDVCILVSRNRMSKDVNRWIVAVYSSKPINRKNAGELVEENQYKSDYT